MFLCAKYCLFLGASSICIHTVDADVLILSFYYSAQENDQFPTLNLSVYVNVLGRSEEQLLNVTDAGYDTEMRRALPGLHAVTGCDSTSAFFRRGKIKGLRLMQANVP